MDMSTLSERIKEIMMSKGLGIPQVAQMCGCTYQAVKKWLNGSTMSIEGAHLVTLAKKTGYEAEWIILGTGPKHREYAKNKPQSLALQAMEKLPPEEQYKIPAFVDLLAKPDGKEGRQ